MEEASTNSNLSNLLPDESKIEEQLLMLYRATKRYTKGKVDYESLSHDLWLWAREHNQPLTQRFIRFRCMDLLRKETLRKQKERSRERKAVRLQKPRPKTDEQTIDRDEISRLVKHSNLSLKERLCLYHCFWAGRSAKETGEELGMSKANVQRLINSGLEKLREELKNPNL